MEVAPVRVLAGFAVVYLVWGSTYLAIAWAVESIPPLLMIGARCLLAGAALYGWTRVRGGARPSLSDWGDAVVAGVLLFVTGQAVLAWAETRIPSSAASLLIATEPLFIALLGWRGRWLTGVSGRAPGPSAIVAVVLGFVGVAVLVLGSAAGAAGAAAEPAVLASGVPGAGRGVAGPVGLDLLGAGAAVLASLSWSVGVLRVRPRPGVSPAARAGMQLLTAGAVLMALSPLAGESPVTAVARLSPRSVAAFLYLVVFGSIVAFGAYVWLLDRVGATRLSSHAYVNPLVAVVLGVALNAEPLGPSVLVAALLILGSVALLLRSRKAQESASVSSSDEDLPRGGWRTHARQRAAG